MAFISDPFANFTMAGVKPDSLMRVRASQSYALRCADDTLLAIHISSPTKFWMGMLTALGRLDLAQDPRFSERAGRLDNYEQLAVELNKTARTQGRAYWIERLLANDVPHAPVLTLPEVMEDPQVKHLNTFAEISHPVHGPQTTIRRPVLYNGQREDQPLNPAPTLGEHSAEVFRSIGLSQEAIDSVMRGE